MQLKKMFLKVFMFFYVTGYYGEKKITWNIAVIPNDT